MNKPHLLAPLALALALTFGFGATAEASPIGHRFCEKPLAPAELAEKLERSLQSDPTGNRPLDGCRAKPLDFLEAWENEETGVTEVSELPALVRRLVEVETTPGLIIPSACIRQDGNGVITKCEPRLRHPSEKVYGINGVALLMGDCVNPINLKIEPVVVTLSPCVRIEFPTQVGSDVKIAYIDRVALPSRCLLLEGPGAGETMRGLPQECPNTYERMIGDRKVTVSCSWREVEQAVSRLLGFRAQVQNLSGSFRARGAGTNVLTLPREALNGEVAICYVLPDGRVVTLGVRREDYVGGVATLPPAMVYGPNPALYRGN